MYLPKRIARLFDEVRDADEDTRENLSWYLTMEMDT